MLNQLKGVNVERLDLHEVVEWLVHCELVLTASKRYKLTPSEWLVDITQTLRREVMNRRRDNLALALKKAEGRLETLRSPKEMRADTKAEIDRLRSELEDEGS